MSGTELTRETFLNRKLILYQPKIGYRFSLDAFLLAGFVKPKRKDQILELGSGCGVVSLLLAYRHPKNKFIGLEIQTRLVRCFQMNIKANQMEKRVFAIQGDLRRPPFRPHSFDLVLTNPPFYPVGRGRLPPHEEDKLARHEILAGLEHVAQTAQNLLKPKGRLDLIYPASRLDYLLNILDEYLFRPKTLRLVHSYPGDEGRLVLLEAVKGGGRELRVLPPLFIYVKKGGAYTAEVEQLFAP